MNNQSRKSFFGTELWEAIRFIVIIALLFYILCSCADSQQEKSEIEYDKNVKYIVNHIEESCAYFIDDCFISEEDINIVKSYYLEGEREYSENDAIDALDSIISDYYACQETIGDMHNGCLAIDTYEIEDYIKH